MRSDTILLQQRFLGEVELQRVIRAETDVQPGLEKVGERVAFVSQEQGVVAQRAHCHTYLLQIEEVLQRRDLPQENTVGDGMGGEER